MENAGSMDLRKCTQERQRLKEEYEALILKAGRTQRHENWGLLEKPTFRLVFAAPVAILQLCHVVVDVMLCSANKRQNWTPRSGVAALKVVEDFSLRLWDSPWKHELRNIKQYSGFYKGNISNKLENGVKLFEQMGYRASPGKELRMKKVSEDTVRNAAFEMFFGRALLHYLAEIHERVKHRGFSVPQIWSARAKCHGDPEQVSNWILTNLDSPHRHVKAVAPPHASVICTQPSSQNDYIYSNITKPLPGNATMLKTSSFSSESVDTIASEKSFKDTGTEEKSKINNGKDSGYISATNSRELTKEDARTEGHVKTRLQPRGIDSPVHKEVKHLHALYKPATQDEHVEMSLQALQQQEVAGTDNTGWPPDGNVKRNLVQDWTFLEKQPHAGQQFQQTIPTNIDVDDAFEQPSFDEKSPQEQHAPVHYDHVLSSPLQFDSHHFEREGPVDQVSSPQMYSVAVGVPGHGRCMPYGEPIRPNAGLQGLVVADGPDEVDGGAVSVSRGFAFSTFGKTSPQQTPACLHLQSTGSQDDPDYVPAWPQADAGSIYRMDESLPPPPPELVNASPEGEDSVSALLKDTQHHIDKTLDTHIEHIDRSKAFSPESEAMLSRTQCHSLIAGDFQHDGFPSAFKSLPQERSDTSRYASKAHYAATDTFDDTVSDNRDQVDSGAEECWQCMSCTYRNKLSADICDMCNKSRQPGSEKDQLQSGDIQCGYCTLINTAKASHCAACHRSLKRSATYI